MAHSIMSATSCSVVPVPEFLANGKKRQHVHSPFQKDQLRPQHSNTSFHRQQRKGDMEGVKEDNLDKSQPEKSAYK